MHPYPIFQSIFPSPQIHKLDHQRHSSLNPFQPPEPITPSIIPPYPPCSFSHTMANKSILDAKIKNPKSKNPQQSKFRHVPSKIHVPKAKHLIQIQEKVKRPQRPKLQKSKIMWIPKMLIKEMHLKEKNSIGIYSCYSKGLIHSSSIQISTYASFIPPIHY